MPRPIDNPPNPWASHHVEWIGEPPPARLHVYHEQAKTILSRNDSPDLPFRYSLNPYRGCFHACAYCYARPSHQYWDFGAGSDFERRLVVKVNAPERLEAGLKRPSWKGEPIVFSGNTDCYQPLEASYELTRRCLEVCAAFCNPVTVITKGALVRRDAALLARLAAEARARVHISLGWVDPKLARAIEPSAPSPRARFDAMRALADAGVPVGVSVSPILPGLNDDQLVEVLERAAEAGATSAFRTLLRLPGPVATIFEERVRAELPLRADKVMNAIREMRGGALYRAEFGERMVGRGARWQAIADLFDATCRRLGLEQGERSDAPMHDDSPSTTFRRPGEQISLFA